MFIPNPIGSGFDFEPISPLSFKPPTLYIKRLTQTAIIPRYQHSTDSGMDLHYDGPTFNLDPSVVEGFETGRYIQTDLETFPEVKYRLVLDNSAKLSTGIAIQLPPNTEAQIRPRSGLADKHGITVVNSPGTVDEGYQGEIKVILMNLGGEPVLINSGDRIAQMVIAPVIRPSILEVKEFTESSERGDGGFGHTGVSA